MHRHSDYIMLRKEAGLLGGIGKAMGSFAMNAGKKAIGGLSSLGGAAVNKAKAEMPGIKNGLSSFGNGAVNKAKNAYNSASNFTSGAMKSFSKPSYMSPYDTASKGSGAKAMGERFGKNIKSAYNKYKPSVIQGVKSGLSSVGNVMSSTVSGMGKGLSSIGSGVKNMYGKAMRTYSGRNTPMGANKNTWSPKGPEPVASQKYTNWSTEKGGGSTKPPGGGSTGSGTDMPHVETPPVQTPNPGIWGRMSTGQKIGAGVAGAGIVGTGAGMAMASGNNYGY